MQRSPSSSKQTSNATASFTPNATFCDEAPRQPRSAAARARTETHRTDNNLLHLSRGALSSEHEHEHRHRLLLAWPHSCECNRPHACGPIPRAYRPPNPPPPPETPRRDSASLPPAVSVMRFCSEEQAWDAAHRIQPLGAPDQPPIGSATAGQHYEIRVLVGPDIGTARIPPSPDQPVAAYP
jgi:hypothetical protein